MVVEKSIRMVSVDTHLEVERGTQARRALFAAQIDPITHDTAKSFGN